MANWTTAGNAHGFNGGGTSTTAMVFTSVAAGSLLIAAFQWSDETLNVVSVVDDVNGAWTPIGSVVSTSGNGAGRLFYFNGFAAAGTTTVTATLSGSTSTQLQGLMYTGGSSLNLDGHAESQLDGVTSISVNLTTTGISDLVFASCMTFGGPFPTQSNSGYTTQLQQVDIHSQILFDNPSVGPGTGTISVGNPVGTDTMTLLTAAFGVSGAGDTFTLSGRWRLS